jgi:hypothetical protein
MRKLKFVSSALAGLALLSGYSWHATAAGKTDTAQSLHRAVPAGAPKYGAIDGKHLWHYVVEQAEIARHYRDNGHPQFWGRFAGTSGDVEDAQWLLDKYRQIGLADTHTQTVAFFAPQYSAQSWSMTATAADKTVPISSAQPAYGSPATDGKEFDLPIVYVGLGSEADFAGRDVRGKAVLLVKVPASYQAGPADILKRAEDHGAAAILSTDLRG